MSARQNEPLCVPVLLTLKFAPRAVLVCNKQYQATALEGSSYSEAACLLNFWLSPGLQDPFAHVLWLWGFSVYRRDFFFLVNLCNDFCVWFFYCDFTDILVPLCTWEPMFVQRLGYWWHRSSCWKPSCLSFQQDNACVTSFFYNIQIYFNARFVMYLYRRCNK